jgi:hypothetical protein
VFSLRRLLAFPKLHCRSVTCYFFYPSFFRLLTGNIFARKYSRTRRNRPHQIVRLLDVPSDSLMTTNLTSSMSLLTDVNIVKTSLDPSIFPGVPKVEVHEGFKIAHQATASQILQEVDNLISSRGATQVITVSVSC